MKIILEALKNLVTKPFTRRYPVEKLEPYPRFRGNIVFNSRKCIGCRRCANNCPSQAIKFIKGGKIRFDMSTCIYCGLCVDVCPVKALAFNQEFELANRDKKKFIR